MEVHHHPHVEKKNFKEYFLEFLMIFLAVTLGFFAENVREHFGNKEKEKQYMQSFYEDLSTDEKQLPRLIDNIVAEQIQPADSLPLLFAQADKKKPANDIYIFLRRIFRQQGIKPFITDKTIDQIKNTGEMRLLTNQQISHLLENYYKQVEYDDYLQQMLLGYKNKLKDDIPLILRAGDYRKVEDAENGIITKNDNLYLGSIDPATINRIEIAISEIESLSKLIQLKIITLKNMATTIKKIIAEKYDVE